MVEEQTAIVDSMQEDDRIRQERAKSNLILWTLEYRRIKGLEFSFEE